VPSSHNLGAILPALMSCVSLSRQLCSPVTRPAQKLAEEVSAPEPAALPLAEEWRLLLPLKPFEIPSAQRHALDCPI
jgi:hypothetical protein